MERPRLAWPERGGAPLRLPFHVAKRGGSGPIGAGGSADKNAKATMQDDVTSDRSRLRRLIADGTLVHPMSTSGFTDLTCSIAHCCGVSLSTRTPAQDDLAQRLGGRDKQHIVFVLCDGLGTNIINEHCEPGSFLRKHNQPLSLVAVFPSTTPAALATLATGAWPGQHGCPGWNLRDQAGCEFPGEPTSGPVHLRVLDSVVKDARTNEDASALGFASPAAVYVKPPWTEVGASCRKMLFVNAYNRSGFSRWSKGTPHDCEECIRDTGEVDFAPLPPTPPPTPPTDNNGDRTATQRPAAASVSESAPSDAASEAAAETIGRPEGTEAALRYLDDALGHVAARLAEAEAKGWRTYSYVYTAHPDKHMHALGTVHEEVSRLVRGIDSRLASFWRNSCGALDATLLITADHGHISVEPEHMVQLPPTLVECLEYANVGVHGVGRHAYFHCRAGRQADFARRWRLEPRLCASFLLLTIEEASEEKLFGPEPPLPQVRPRMGDYVAIALTRDTIVTPKEKRQFGETVQGAHGSLLPEEMRIPFVCLTTSRAPTKRRRAEA